MTRAFAPSTPTTLHLTIERERCHPDEPGGNAARNEGIESRMRKAAQLLKGAASSSTAPGASGGGQR